MLGGWSWGVWNVGWATHRKPARNQHSLLLYGLCIISCLRVPVLSSCPGFSGYGLQAVRWSNPFLLQVSGHEIRKTTCSQLSRPMYTLEWTKPGKQKHHQWKLQNIRDRKRRRLRMLEHVLWQQDVDEPSWNGAEMSWRLTVIMLQHATKACGWVGNGSLTQLWILCAATSSRQRLPAGTIVAWALWE